MTARLTYLLVALALLLGAPVAHADDPPDGTTWTEEYFASGDGTMLHADVLRPKSLPKDARTPVLLTVSPYTNHSGQTGPEGNSGPSGRFNDFTVPARIWERGYTYVIVDLRGTGGSAGCNDWGGPGERMDAKAAVEWAASRPWSTGSVGVLGKSYDGWTGLMAIAERPKGLAAVLSMEPVYSGYRYLYMDGVRFVNSVATPGSFTAIDAMPGSSQDSVEYHVNGTGPNGPCYGANIGQQQLDDPTVDFWRARDLIPDARGATTPLFLTQGFLEANTKPDGAFAFFNGMAGPKRAWFGEWDHVRGWETNSDGELMTGRGGFIEEAMRFFDHYVKGVPLADARTDRDPPVVVQGADGRFRSERVWPPADAVLRTTKLRAGSYVDDGKNNGDGGGAGIGLWSISAPLPHAAHLTGEPVVELDVTATPRSNLVVNVYDIGPDNQALMISRGAMLIRGESTRVSPEMYGQDWPLAAGHRIGVLVSGANSEWWVHAPTNQPVTVSGGTIALPFVRDARGSYIDGVAGPRLRGFLTGSAFAVPAATITEAATAFEEPPALRPPPPPSSTGGAPHPAAKPARTLTIRAIRRGKVIEVRGRACVGNRVTVTLLRGRRTVARRRFGSPNGGCRTYRVRIRTRARGRLSARVLAEGLGQVPASRRTRVRTA